MADKNRRHLMLLQEVSLERQQAQHVVAGFAQHTHPTAAPGPYRGRNVVHRRYAGCTRGPLDTQIEVRRIDADVQIRRISQQARLEFANDPPQPRQVTHHLGKAHHGQFIAVPPGFGTGGLHQRPGNAGEADIGMPRLHGADQAGTEPVSGNFTRNDGNPRHARSQRIRLRSELSMKSTRMRSSGWVSASAAIRSRASASCRPSR